MKKPDVNAVIKPMPNAWKADPWRNDYPNLSEFLSCTKWENGEVRLTGSMSIFTQLGVLKMCITDKSMNRMTFVEAPTFDELLACADAAICDANTVWRGTSRTPTY